jgi:flavin reductase (DIM6/NTAB) family NADH-FMN oxidoreductase RutF
LGRFTSGVTVITTELKGSVHGMTANAFMSVSLEPPLVIVSVDNRAQMNRMLLVGRTFGVSVLAEDQESLSNHFAGRSVDGLDIRFVKPTGTTPLMEGALAHLVANVIETHPAGDHTLYLGKVEYVAWREAKPLLFFGGKYYQIKIDQPGAEAWPEDDMSMFSFGSFDLPIT